jgi:predicted glutamine amidotransferase
MCRVLLYAGTALPLDDLLYRPSSSLVRQSWDPRQLKMLNLGGFGLAAWDPSSHRPDVPFSYRSTTLPVFDGNLRSLAEKVRASCVLAHVRGVPYEVHDGYGEHNLHPFQYPGRAWAMAHNGWLHGFASMRQALVAQLPAALVERMRGTTDSEGVYALVMSLLDEPGSDDPDALAGAVLAALRILRQLRHARGLELGSALNLFFTNGRDCVALRYAFDFGCYPTDDPGGIEEMFLRYASLWYTVGERFGAEGGQWRMTGDPARSDSVLIASEPLTHDTTGWVEVPEYTLVVARRTGDGVRVKTLAVDV